MKELHRVLKPGGWGIAMVPITNAIEETYENDSITTDADRWKYFGQDDHVRMYSKKGFVGNLEKAGFKVDQLGIDYFGSNVFERHGIHPRSILYIVSKI
jgi:predicted SAM-dependent methyltransferase